MGFRLHLKWGSLLSTPPSPSPSSSSSSSSSTPPSSSWPSSYSCRGRDSSHFLPRLPAASVLYAEAETLNETYRTPGGSSSPLLLENYFSRTRETKVPIGKGYPSDSVYSFLDGEIQTSCDEDELARTVLQATDASHFRLLMKNLDMLEVMCADSNAARLEGEILEQLERLGAMRLFHSCLSRTLKFSSSSDFLNTPNELLEEPRENDSADNHAEKVIVSSGKKELRKLRRKSMLKESHTSMEKMCSDTVLDYYQRINAASSRRSSKSRNKRHKIAKNEAEMSSAVKMVAGLEKIRMVLEEETGRATSSSRWAEAAGIKNKELLQRLYYGWHCRDELLRSTHSLVLFIARNYGGLGVAFEDLIQAGNIGVLQGAERFDQSRGYKFSTYVQYWIRKSISTLVAKHARGVRITSTLSKVINQVQKARKALSTSHGKYPDDGEIVQYTGLPMAKITSASKCLRVVGSIDQNVWDGIGIKYTEIMADTSIPSPEETVARKHMRKDVHALLDGLDARERDVLVLRYGLGNRQCKSLDEIGRLYSVSKEWIRKIERSALTKLRDENTLQVLNHYVHLQQ